MYLVDTGSLDPWRTPAIASTMGRVSGIAHEWHVDEGGHDLAYWSAHMNDYLTCCGRRLH